MQKAGDPNFMSSLARGLAVIRGFSNEERHQRRIDKIDAAVSKLKEQ